MLLLDIFLNIGHRMFLKGGVGDGIKTVSDTSEI